MKRLALTLVGVVLALGACAPAAPRNTGVYLLLDTSGTYSNELRKAETIILYTLARLEPSDSFAVARIDTGSFSEKDIVAKATFDDPIRRSTPTSAAACCRRSSSSTKSSRDVRRS